MDTPLPVTDRLFHTDLAPEDAMKRLREGTAGAEDGELFMEYRESEAISLDDGRIRSASYDTQRGFGLRAVHGEAAGYAHAGEISDAALARAAAAVQAVRQGRSGTLDVAPRATNARLYEPTNPLLEMDFAAKTALLMEIDAHARALDPRVVQVSASITGEWQAVQILRPDGSRVADIRPLVRFNVSIVVEENGRRETGSFGTGGASTIPASSKAAAGSAAWPRPCARPSSTFPPSPPRPASRRWCSAPAGPASSCTRPSATGSKATSTARRPRLRRAARPAHRRPRRHRDR
jgi:TldD protein